MRPFLAAAVAAAALFAAPLAADHHATTLKEVLAADIRDGDRARDAFRNPAETLAFFGVEPGMTVAEFSPGGGWYTRVLAPYLSHGGRYLAFQTDSDGGNYRDRAQEVRAKGWTENFTAMLAAMPGVMAANTSAFEIDEMPESLAGSVDRVLIFRSMHGLNNANQADTVLKAARMMLKDDGMVGVVQHRAPKGASYDEYGARQRGYMRTQDVVAIFAANGFELAGSSEINANPKDPANWDGGVWMMPPTLAGDDAMDARTRDLGESDRMTLLFRKVD